MTKRKPMKALPKETQENLQSLRVPTTASHSMKSVAKPTCEPDRIVQRGSHALIRHARRKQMSRLGNWLALLALLALGLSITGYLISANINRLPWQHYLDRFDFRLTTDSGTVNPPSPMGQAASDTIED